jgi:hypothetical protein
MAKGEISWKERTPEGISRQVYAKKVGKEWRFYVRQQRYDRWEALPEPPLEDWLVLLDGVQRRISRRLLRPEEEERVKKVIKERFPEAVFH